VREHARIFGRGFVLVFLVALNTRMIATANLPGALGAAFAVSWVWWGNSRSASSCDVPWARECYAAGAGLATVCALLLTA
jgi:hypothetical protein